jgi:hypothetical protein
VTQHHDLDVLRPLAVHVQHDQLQHLPQDQVSERQDHAGHPASDRRPASHKNRTSDGTTRFSSGTGRSKDTTRRSDLAGWAQYGYCASHSRYFWGLRLHLVCTLGGLPIGFALTGAKADERQTLLGILNADPTLTGDRPGQTLIGDKNYYGRDFERTLSEAGIDLLRPARKGEPPRPGARLFKPCARPSSRSTRPSKDNSTWNATAVTPSRA